MTDDLSFSWSVAAKRATMAASDPAAALQPIRDRAGIVAKLGPPRPGDDLAGAAHRSAADVPRLLKAAEAALAFHEESGGSCGSCLDAYGDRIEWPCEEYRAITAELAGKDAGDEQHAETGDPGSDGQAQPG